MDDTLRKHKLLRLLTYSVLANVPDELWANHRTEIEAMRRYMGDTWEDTGYGELRSQFKTGPVYAWITKQAIEIWENGSNEWYNTKVKPWLDTAKITWD